MGDRSDSQIESVRVTRIEDEMKKEFDEVKIEYEECVKFAIFSSLKL